MCQNWSDTLWSFWNVSMTSLCALGVCLRVSLLPACIGSRLFGIKALGRGFESYRKITPPLFGTHKSRGLGAAGRVCLFTDGKETGAGRTRLPVQIERIQDNKSPWWIDRYHLLKTHSTMTHKWISSVSSRIIHIISLEWRNPKQVNLLSNVNTEDSLIYIYIHCIYTYLLIWPS